VKLVPFALASLVLLLSCTPRDAVAPSAELSFAITAGNNYYVSPSGSDANPCSAASPCYTMQRVSQLLAPGDIAHFASGNYTWSWSGNRVAKSGTPSAPITYISDAKWGAKIYGPTCAPIYNDGDYVQIINFDVTTGTCPDGIITNGNYSKVIGNRVHDLPGSSGGVAGILGDCCYYNRTGIQIIANVVDNVGPLGQTNLIHGIYLGGPNGVITNNIVTRASAACIHLYHGTTRMIIANNVVANCGRYGILVSAEGARTTDDYTTVANNIVVNTPGRGIYEYPAVGTHNVFYNNIVYNNSPNFDLIYGTQSGTITLTSAQFSALFVNYTGDRNGDYHLRSGAVAIDAGTTRCAAGVSGCVPLTDFDGVSRPQGPTYDIGAYEYEYVGASGPVASWSFDEGSGQTAADGSGNSNTATLGVTTAVESSDPLWVQGRMSNALQFDGSSSRVTVPGSPTINNLSAFTYAAWIYPTGAGGGGYGRIFAKESSTGFDDFYFLGNTAIEADINNTVGTQFAARAAATLAWNAWSHVAVTYNDSGDRKLHLYLNGSEVAYSRQDVTSGTLRTTSNTLMTGNRIAGDRSFQGKIDDARVYNRALSSSEVAALFNSAP
jgi:concanavalin A-like lectin/glucanase superfamily protein/parallel beta helix pectate lyase-like protein